MIAPARPVAPPLAAHARRLADGSEIRYAYSESGTTLWSVADVSRALRNRFRDRLIRRIVRDGGGAACAPRRVENSGTPRLLMADQAALVAALRTLDDPEATAIADRLCVGDDASSTARALAAEVDRGPERRFAEVVRTTHGVVGADHPLVELKVSVETLRHIDSEISADLAATVSKLDVTNAQLSMANARIARLEAANADLAASLADVLARIHKIEAGRAAEPADEPFELRAPSRRLARVEGPRRHGAPRRRMI